MTTYDASAVSNTVIAYKKAITLQVARQLRDNPLAMFEGAAGAPRLQFAAMDAWYTTPGGVGSYVFAQGTADKAFGATIAGSALNPTSAATRVGYTGTGAFAALTQGAALSGTWQCMGTFDLTAGTNGSTMVIDGVTLWQRIA